MRITAAAARRILRGQGMPPQEIRALLASDDPLVVRRLLELHRERLGEWVEEQQRLVASIERSFGAEPGEGGPDQPRDGAFRVPTPCTSAEISSARR